MRRVFSATKIPLFIAMVLACASPLGAEELVIPQPQQVQSAIEHYVNDAKASPGVVVGLVQDGQRQLYSHGESGRSDLSLDGDTLFEIGSITKVFTGLLLADMVQRGEVGYQTPISELMPAEYPLAEAVGAITLEQLATHTSGLPRLATGFGPVMRAVFSSDPYAGSTPGEIFQAVAQLADYQLNEKGEFAYSNLGFALLGQLLAIAADSDYENLLEQRVLVPMGVPEIALGPGLADQDRFAQGFNRGRTAAHWNMDAYTPAGGLVASANQMLDFIEANLAPELLFVSEAQRPTGPSTDTRQRPLGIGFAHREIGGQQLLWHNGGTGGFRTYFGFAPELDFGIVIVTNGTGNADALAESLIRSDAPGPDPYQRSWFGILTAMLGVLIAPLTLLAGALGKEKAARPGRRAQDRFDLMVLIAAAGMMLVISRLSGDWISIPFSLWWLGAVVSLAATAALLRTKFAGRLWRTGGPWSLLGRALSVLFCVLVIVAFI